MSGLQEHLDRYLSVRRSLGYQLDHHRRVLPDYVRYAQSRGETTVRTQIAIAWASDAPSENQASRRLSTVRAFARYLAAFDPATEVPRRGLLPGGQVRSTPHVYSET